MFQQLFAFSLSFLACLSAFSQSADKKTGNWAGTISGAGLPIYFHISGDPASGYKGQWSSLKEQALGLPCKTVVIRDDSLVIETAVIKAIFRGKYLPGTDSITGIWEQNGYTAAMNLHKLYRPQTPQPPFPYRSDSVEYDNADASVHLGATLTRPAANKREPGKKYSAVILITGSGQQDRDETILDHKPFAIIADYLTRRGIAVLRVDDRGIGKSRGDLKNATSSDFADDVLAGVRYLKTRKDIDTTRIGLIGHSEGGLIAPIVYSRWPHLKFLVLLAGTGLPGSEIILRQQTDPVRPVSQAAYLAYYPFVVEKLKILNEDYGKPDSSTQQDLKEAYARWAGKLPDSIAAVLHVKGVSPEIFAFSEKREMIPWLRYFYKTDPATYLRQVKCPVLALAGTKDTQVYAAQNIPAIRAALQSGGAPVETIVFPGLNHLFQHCDTGDLSEYALIEESFSPAALKTIGDWIGKTVKL